MINKDDQYSDSYHTASPISLFRLDNDNDKTAIGILTKRQVMMSEMAIVLTTRRPTNTTAHILLSIQAAVGAASDTNVNRQSRSIKETYIQQIFFSRLLSP